MTRARIRRDASRWLVLALCVVLWPDSARAGEPAPQPPSCTVSTDIPELRDRYGDALQRACGPGIKAVEITGDHERIIYLIQYAADWRGRKIAHDVPHAEASTAARMSCSLLRDVYPSKVCAYRVRDGMGRPVCATEVAEDGSGSTVCVSVVGEDDKEGTVS